MKESQTEIKAIQAKLRAIRTGQSQLRQPESRQPKPRQPEPRQLEPRQSARAATAMMVELTPSLSHEELTEAPVPTIVPGKPIRNPVPQPGVTTYQPRYHSNHQNHQSQPSNQRHEVSYEALSSNVEALQQRSDTYLRQIQTALPAHPSHAQMPAAPEPARLSAEKQMEEAFQRLEAKANQINQLSVAQETALLELKAIADRLERDWKALEREGEPLADLDIEVPPICEYMSATVPLVEKDDNGAFVLTTRPVDLYRSEREAALTAQALRHRTVHANYPAERADRAERAPGRWTEGAEHNPSETWVDLWKKFLDFLGVTNAQKSLSQKRRLPRSKRRSPAASTSFSAQDAVLWLIGAIVARVGLDLVLAAYPGLWIPVVGLIVAPAAMAVYRTSTRPQTSMSWAYRLFVIMIGLLIGGRL